MINLIPDATKGQMLYARRNRILIKWVSAMFVGILGIGAVVLAGYIYIRQTTNAYADEVRRTKESLASQNLEETRARVEDISNSTKLALEVLSRQILFSRLLQQIGAAMPAGAALQNLSIGKLQGGIDLQAVAADYQTATQVQINLQDPDNKIFEKADILNISCADVASSQDSINALYPCQVTIRALFAKDSEFLFTNTNKGSTP